MKGMERGVMTGGSGFILGERNALGMLSTHHEQGGGKQA